MNKVVIRKIGGFYNIFDNDAIIINYLFDYKIVNNRSGFPLNSLDKVINILEDNKVSYKVIDNDATFKNKDYKKVNKYNYVLDKGKKKIDIEYKIIV